MTAAPFSRQPVDAEAQDEGQRGRRRWLGPIVQHSQTLLPKLQALHQAVGSAAKVSSGSRRLLRASRVLGRGVQTLEGVVGLVHTGHAVRSREWERAATHGARSVGCLLMLVPAAQGVGAGLVAGCTVYGWLRDQQTGQIIKPQQRPPTR